MISSWDHIWLGELPCRYGSDGHLTALLAANHGGFRLQLIALVRDVPSAFEIARIGRGDATTDALLADPRFVERLRQIEEELSGPIRAKLPRSEAIGVALVNGGRRVEIETEIEPFTGSTGNQRSRQYNESWDLPWPDDPLADTWLCVRIDDATHVIELPYGVCRDERRPLDARAVEPSVAPAGVARRWSRIDYEGEPMGAWRVRFQAEAAHLGALTVELYRHDLGTSTAPDVEVSVAPVATPGRTKVVPRAEPWRRVDSMRLAARFAVPGVEPGRHYVRVAARVGAHAHCVVVPSSLLAI